VSLIVDDIVLFVGAAIALIGTYVVAHHVRSLREVAGYGLFAVVWIALGLSFARASSGRRRRSTPDN
jgi:hypothetical protein